MIIHVEYCIKWNYFPEFDRVSKTIKSIQSNIKIQSNQIKPKTGSFEVKLNNVLVFSKFATGRFPKKEEIESWFK